MQFTPSNRNDIEKYYLGTFIKIKQQPVETLPEVPLNPDTLYYIDHVDSMKVTGKNENDVPFCIWLSDKFPFEIDYVLPHKSFFQQGKNAVLLERIPAQQYYRGIHQGNTQMTYLHGSLVKKLPINFNNLKAFVTKQSFYSLSGAVASSHASCVLTPRMAYNSLSKTINIDHIPVAKVDKDKIGMIKPIFTEEVNNMLVACGDQDKFTITPPKPAKAAVSRPDEEVLL